MASVARITRKSGTRFKVILKDRAGRIFKTRTFRKKGYPDLSRQSQFFDRRQPGH